MGSIWDTKPPIISDVWKHAHLKHKFIINHVRRAEVDSHYGPSNQTTANLLTETLKEIKFKKMVGLIKLAYY